MLLDPSADADRIYYEALGYFEHHEIAGKVVLFSAKAACSSNCQVLTCQVMTDHCRSCNSPIIWAITDKGKRLPLDAEPDPRGNVRLTLTNAVVLAKGDDYAGPRYVPHFATCPNAASHRKR